MSKLEANDLTQKDVIWETWFLKNLKYQGYFRIKFFEEFNSSVTSCYKNYTVHSNMESVRTKKIFYHRQRHSQERVYGVQIPSEVLQAYISLFKNIYIFHF